MKRISLVLLLLFTIDVSVDAQAKKKSPDDRESQIRKEINSLKAKIAALEEELATIQKLPYIGPIRKVGKSIVYSFKEEGTTGHLGKDVFYVDRVYNEDLFVVRIANFRFLVVRSKTKNLSDDAPITFSGIFVVEGPVRLQTGETLATVRPALGPTGGKVLRK